MKKSITSRFKALRTLALLLRVLAWLSLLGGLVVAVMFIISPDVLSQYRFFGWYIYNSAWLSALVTMISAVLYAIIFFAAAECVYVFLSIEDNTRRLRELLDKK